MSLLQPQPIDLPNRLALRIREFAEAVGVSERTVWSWTKRESDPLPTTKIDSTVVISIESAKAWLARHENVGKES